MGCGKERSEPGKESDTLQFPQGIRKRRNLGFKAGYLAAFLLIAMFIFPLGNETASALRETYVFDGSGWGHGVGMCQYGARGMAAAGFNYQQILTYYYQGTRVSDWACPPSIRVGLLEAMSEIQLTADSGSFILFTSGGDIPGGTVNQGSTWKIRPSADGRFLIYKPDGSLLNGTSYGSTWQPLYVRGVSEGNVLRLPQNGNRRLSHLTEIVPLELNVYGSPYTLRAILISWFETYLKGVDEVPGSWPQEAVKAQAVAARSYAVRSMNKHASSNYDICDEVHCQYFRGYDKEKDTGWVQAVDATRGKVLTYQGQVAQCFYSSSCGGHTDNNEDVWGGNPVPYLRGVPDPYCMSAVNPYAHWTVTYSREEIEARLNANSGTYVGTLYSVDLSSRTPSGRVRWAVFKGSAGKVTVSGEKLRSLLSLRSAMVNLRPENFEEYILLANPSGSTAKAVVKMIAGGGRTEEAAVELPPYTRRTVRVNDYLDGEEVAVQVEADRDITAERAIYFSYRGNVDGGSCSPGISSLSNNWYLAEGYTALAFDTWILLYNPGPQAAHADVRLMRDDGYTRSLSLEIPASSRVTLNVDAQEGFSACAFSTQVNSNQPLAVERAMYFDSEGRKGGHTAEGSPELSTRWYFAEGYTGGNFDTWILVGNPGDQPAAVKFHLLPQGGGGVRTVERIVPARSRFTLHVDDYLPRAEVAVSLESDQPVVAERAMYFDYFGKEDGSCAMGSRKTASRWFLAEGYTGGDFDEYVLVGNPLGEAARVKISLFTQGGLQKEVYADLAPRSRYTLHVDDLIPSEDVSVQVEEVNGKGVVVERAMYFDYAGRKGGHASQGINETSIFWYFAEGYTGY